MYINNFSASVISNNQVLRENNDVIRLPFGSQYAIRLQNHNNVSKALVSVKVDGKDALSDRQIILQHGETLDLEGFMSASGAVSNKFKFVEKIKEIVDYRGESADDGFIEIKFQFEAARPIMSYRGYAIKSKGLSNDHDRWNRESMVAYNASCETHPVSCDGVTVKGEESNQNFIDGHVGALTGLEYTIRFKLQGDVKQKVLVRPVTVKTKLKCDACGKLSKSSFKFCPRCGNALF